MTKTEAIKNFLNMHAMKYPSITDLVTLYNFNMEVQVTVKESGGRRVNTEFKGKHSHSYTDGINTWKPFRIPWNAKTVPEYTDSVMSYNLLDYADGVGLTGWDWVNKQSKWVGFDYDAITGHSDRHSKKLTESELRELEDAVSVLPWITIRQSTSGKGRHIYVFVNDIPTINHDEHAALARSILSMMSGQIGYDFNSKVDVVGGNLWIWHDKLKESNGEGLRLIKRGETLIDIPKNIDGGSIWREHIPVINGTKKKTVPIFVREDTNTTEDLFNELVGQHSNVALDKEHLRLIHWLNDNELNSWWDNDHHMLVTHTAYLHRAHEELGLKGIFKTIAQGTEYGNDINAFCFSGDILVQTYEGTYSFKQLYDRGTPVRLLSQISNTEKRFIESTIEMFGEQQLCEITFENDLVVQCTPDHQWPYYDALTKTFNLNKRCTTTQLLPFSFEGKLIRYNAVLWNGQLLRAKYITVHNEGKNTEPVYCAIVPTYHNFYLANGILTGNCFPLRHGTWSVRRYNKGTAEVETWSQDNKGYTRCYLNRDPDFETACIFSTGNLNDKDGFVFPEAELAAEAVKLLGGHLDIPAYARARKTILRRSKTDRLTVEIVREDNDDPTTMREKGFNPEGKTIKVWQKVFPIKLPSHESEVQNYDDIVRHLITEDDEEYGWALFSEGTWKKAPTENAKLVMSGLVDTAKQVNIALGNMILKSWRVVNRPFQPEYLEGRTWNMKAAQFLILPNREDNRHFPNWQKILTHIGRNLDDVCKTNKWCLANGIDTGSDYIKCWLASVVQHPLEPLPYLFLYSIPEDSGKSMFVEALRFLFTKGITRGDNSLINQSAFNGELEHAIVVAIEEINLSSKTSTAYNRIKDWVTARELPIHKKGKTPYLQPNSTHWVQTANDPSYCPVFPGDTRIVVIRVDQLDPAEKIPKYKFEAMLKKEASDFLGELISLELPEPIDRLYIPVLETQEKSLAQKSNMTHLELFLSERYTYVEGHCILMKEFAEEFHDWMKSKGLDEDIPLWSKIKINRELKPPFAAGRSRKDNQVNLINISSNPNAQPSKKLVIKHDKIYIDGDAQ